MQNVLTVKMIVYQLINYVYLLLNELTTSYLYNSIPMYTSKCTYFKYFTVSEQILLYKQFMIK